jgi:hypothetical protein
MISGLIKILNHMVFITKSLFQRDIFEITFFVNNILSIYNSDKYIYILILELYLYSFTVTSPNNRIKRFIYACYAKIFNENYHDSIHADECTLELRQTTIKTWFKLWYYYYYILIYFKN